MQLEFSKVHEKARLPTYATLGSACFDFYTCENTKLEQSIVSLVRTGLCVKVPAGMMLEIRPRSGLSAKGILIANAPGTIDNDYTGEIKILLYSLLEYEIKEGDRIAQGRLVPATQLPIKEIENGWQEEFSVRGTGGFGSTGR